MGLVWITWNWALALRAGTGTLRAGVGYTGAVEVVHMTGQLHTAAEAAKILKIRESWLKTKASARLIPCTFVGKHLRFSDDDIAEIMRVGARQPISSREPRPGHRTA